MNVNENTVYQIITGKFILGELYDTPSSPVNVSEYAIEDIRDILNSWLTNLGSDKYISSVHNAIETSIMTDWLITDSDVCSYTGTFPKRLAKWFKDYTGLKLDSNVLGKIGDTASKDISRHNNEYCQFDFTDTFNWHAGDYGDDGSCYFGDRSDAKQAIEDRGSLAIRFYNSKNEGYGRAWLVFGRTNGVSHAVLFNAYPDNFKLAKIARILSTITGCLYKEVTFENDGESHGELWINNYKGYAIYPAECEFTASLVDFRIPIDEYDVCFHCGNHIYTDDGEYGEYDGEYYCIRCFNRYYRTCESCSEVYSRDDVYSINGEIYCESCCESCESCGEYFLSDDLTDGYCESCHDKLAECAECGESAVLETVSWLDDSLGLCADCLRTNHKCQACYNSDPVETPHIVEGYNLCDEHYNQYARVCPVCGKEFISNNLTEHANNIRVCHDCNYWLNNIPLLPVINTLACIDSAILESVNQAEYIEAGIYYNCQLTMDTLIPSWLVEA